MLAFDWAKIFVESLPVKGITLIEGEIGEQGRQAVVGEVHSTFVSDRTAIPEVWAFSDTGLFRGVPCKEEVEMVNDSVTIADQMARLKGEGRV